MAFFKALSDLADKYLVDNWRQSLKFASLWVYGLVALTPELWALAVEFDMVSNQAIPDVFADAIRAIAFFGAVSRLVNQRLGKFPLLKED